MTPPPALSARLRSRLHADPAAAAFWRETTPSYRRTVVNWVLSAKRDQTRADRMATLIADCAAGRLVPPQRYGDPPAWLARAAAVAARVAAVRLAAATDHARR